MSLRAQRKLGLFLSVHVDERKMVGKKQNTHVENSPKKKIDLEDPTPFIDQVYAGCTYREAKVDALAVQSKTELLKKNSQGQGRLTKKIKRKKIIRWNRSPLGALTWKVMPKVHWEILRIGKSFLQQVATPCIDDHQRPLEDNDTAGEVSAIFAQIVLKCLYLAGIVWTSRFIVVYKHSGTISNKMEQSLRQEMAKLDKLHHSNNELQAVPSCGRSFAGDLLDSKSTSGGLLSVFGSHTFCSHVMDVQEPNRSVSQQCRVWNCVAWRRFTHGWFYQLFVSGSVCWKLCLVKRQRRSLSVTNARESFRRVHILTFVYLSPLLPENLHGSHSTQLYIFEDSAAVDHKINKGRSPSRHATRTHKVDLDWLFEREWIWIILCWSSTCEQQIHWRIFWTKGKFATMQWHSLMNVWQIRRPHESNDVRSFCRKTFLMLSFSNAPSNVSGDDTARERRPDMESMRVTSIEFRLHSG